MDRTPLRTIKSFKVKVKSDLVPVSISIAARVLRRKQVVGRETGRSQGRDPFVKLRRSTKNSCKMVQTSLRKWQRESDHKAKGSRSKRSCVHRRGLEPRSKPNSEWEGFIITPRPTVCLRETHTVPCIRGPRRPVAHQVDCHHFPHCQHLPRWFAFATCSVQNQLSSRHGILS